MKQTPKAKDAAAYKQRGRPEGIPMPAIALGDGFSTAAILPFPCAKPSSHHLSFVAVLNSVTLSLKQEFL